MVWTRPADIEAGDPIDPDWGNDVVACLTGLFAYEDAISLPQPFQPSKPSILVLLAEGVSTEEFPNSVHVFLSADGSLYDEVAACDFPYDGKSHIQTLTVPIPLGYYCYWIAPYGFIKSARLF
jgi:hypothetical protein